MATVTCYPASPTALIDSCVIACADADSNDASAYDAEVYPTSPEMRYRFQAFTAGEDYLVSEEFSTNLDGEHQWTTVMFPVDGTWTVSLIDISDNSTVASASVTVNAAA